MRQFLFNHTVMNVALAMFVVATVIGVPLGFYKLGQWSHELWSDVYAWRAEVRRSERIEVDAIHCRAGSRDGETYLVGEITISPSRREHGSKFVTGSARVLHDGQLEEFEYRRLTYEPVCTSVQFLHATCGVSRLPSKRGGWYSVDVHVPSTMSTPAEAYCLTWDATNEEFVGIRLNWR